MGTVDDRIALPRKKAPVPVKAGAVGIAGFQTGIYPIASPGGWNILGYTPLKMFDANHKAPTLLQPGIKVQFVAISINEYNSLLQP
jgi:inhibitor of KinA